jgi:hypothetical protein
MTEEHNVMVNSESLIGTTAYLTLYTRCLISRCPFKRVRLYIHIHTYVTYIRICIHIHYKHTHMQIHTYITHILFCNNAAHIL